MVDSKGKKVEWLLTEQSVATAVALVTQEFLAGNYPGGVGHGSRSWIADMFLDLPAERLWMPYKVERSSRTNAGNLLRTALHQEERQDRDDYDGTKTHTIIFLTNFRAARSSPHVDVTGSRRRSFRVRAAVSQHVSASRSLARRRLAATDRWANRTVETRGGSSAISGFANGGSITGGAANGGSTMGGSLSKATGCRQSGQATCCDACDVST